MGDNAEELDDELIKDFMGELNDAYLTVEETVFALEQQPADTTLLHDLFRTIHSVKSNLRMMHLTRYSDLMHSAEHILERTRKGEIAYVALLGDLFLLLVNELKALCHSSFTTRATNESHCDEIEAALQRLAGSTDETLQESIRGVIILCDPNFEFDDESGKSTGDLQLFSEFALSQEGRCSSWQGRSERMMEMALEMALSSDIVIDELQLQSAVYLHDLAMAFLPLELVHKPEELSETDQKRMREHPSIAATLLRQLSGWSDAAEMIEQHHEWYDGSGYPAGLKGDEINHGACIIAIVDAFESMTHERADREHKRSVLRAVAEINGMSGKQFDPKWVKIFNDIVRQRYVGRS